METQQYYKLRSLLFILRDQITVLEDDTPIEINGCITHATFCMGGSLCPSFVSENELKGAFKAFIKQLNTNLLSDDIEIVETDFRSVFGCVSDTNEELIFGLDLRNLEKDLTRFHYLSSDKYKRVYGLAIRYADFLKNLFNEGLGNYKQQLLQNQHKKIKEPKKETDLKDYIIAPDETEKERLFKCLCGVMSGKTGKYAILPILLYVTCGKMNKPPHSAIINQFGKVFAKSLYSGYMNLKKYSETEIEGMKKALNL